jgi:acetyl esterase/lipase
VARARSSAAVALLTASALLLASCGGDGSSAEQGSAGPTTRGYGSGRTAYPHVPDGVTAAPVVVMVPGGGWVSADPSGLGPLADALADAGVLAVPVTIRAAQDGVTYPVPVEDVRCALAAGAAIAADAGVEPTALVLLGHSSGAHLSAVAALAPDTVAPTCDDPLVDADGLVGLAGPYDVRAFADGAEALFGTTPEEDPGTWALADPLLLADRRPGLPVLLLHGDADEVVPVEATRSFAAALEAGGHDTTVTIVPGADHDRIYSPDVVAEAVADWVEGLAD